MECSRCGASGDGRFCTECGATLGTRSSDSADLAHRNDVPHAISDRREVDETVLAARRAGWRLELPDGTRIPLASGTTLVGRKPVVQQGRLGARLVRLPDATRSASKTHAALTVDPAGETLTVADLGSTNGTLLSNPAAEPVELAANQTAHVESGAVLMLGDLPVTAQRAT